MSLISVCFQCSVRHPAELFYSLGYFRESYFLNPFCSQNNQKREHIPILRIDIFWMILWSQFSNKKRSKLCIREKKLIFVIQNPVEMAVGITQDDPHMLTSISMENSKGSQLGFLATGYTPQSRTASAATSYQSFPL